MTIALEEHISFEKGEELCKTLGTYFIYKYLGLYKLFEGKSYTTTVQPSIFTRISRLNSFFNRKTEPDLRQF